MAKYTVEKIKALSYDDILRMNEQELREAVSVGVSAANKRLKRLEQKGLDTPFTERTKNKNLDYNTKIKKRAKLKISEEQNKYFSSKGKNQQQLRRELYNLKKFLSNKATTVKGAREQIKKVSEKLAKAGIDYGSFTSSGRSSFWKIYTRLRNEFVDRLTYPSEVLFEAINYAQDISNKYNLSGTEDEVFNIAKDFLDGNAYVPPEDDYGEGWDIDQSI